MYYKKVELKWTDIQLNILHLLILVNYVIHIQICVC